MSTQQLQPVLVERWLASLEQALAALPAKDSAPIIAEAREHIYERVRIGVPPADALAGFGSAEAYARAFKGDELLDKARADRRVLDMLKAVVHFSSRSVVALIALISITVVGYFGLWSLLCIGAKLFRPDFVGLWLDLPLSAQRRYEHAQPDFIPLSFGHDHVIFGFRDPPPTFPEYLGLWIYPILVAVAVLSYYGVRTILRASVNRIRRTAELRPDR
jgi:HAAS domain-containing protein